MSLVRISTDDSIRFSDAFVIKNQVVGLQINETEPQLLIFLINGEIIKVNYSSVSEAEKAMDKLALVL